MFNVTCRFRTLSILSFLKNIVKYSQGGGARGAYLAHGLNETLLVPGNKWCGGWNTGLNLKLGNAGNGSLHFDGWLWKNTRQLTPNCQAVLSEALRYWHHPKHSNQARMWNNWNGCASCERGRCRMCPAIQGMQPSVVAMQKSLTAATDYAIAPIMHTCKHNTLWEKRRHRRRHRRRRWRREEEK